MSTNQTGTIASDEMTLSTYIVSFNCARQLIDVDFFAAHFLDALSTTQSRPDIIALSLQEVAPIAYSFLSPSLLSRYFHRFEIAVKQAFEDKYGAEAADAVQLLATDNVGMTAVMVFVQQEVIARVRRIERGGTGVGLWEMGNKGAVGVRLWLEQPQDREQTASLTFVAAHLAPMESAWKRRNEDWRSVNQRLVFEGDDKNTRGRTSLDSVNEPLLASKHESSMPQMLVAGAHLFFAGDLNYRTSDIKPHPDEHTSWPSSLQHVSSAEAFSALFKHDQLNRERSAGNTLHLMDEARIDFAPTYKYADSVQEIALALAGTSRDSQDRGKQQVWASHRAPSWCDRILYQAGSNTKVFAYTALPIQPTSDHRPVALSATVNLQSSHTDMSTKSPFQLDKEWKSRRAQAKRLEFFVGLAAYLTLTYEGNAILAGTIIGLIGSVVAFRSLLLT